MIVRFTPEFRRDLRNLRLYLKKQGFKSADTIGKDVLQACSNLKNNPQIGLSASERFGIETDMMFLILGKNIVFYRTEKDYIEIVRMLDTRTNIMFRMFGIDAGDTSSEEYWDG